MRVKLHRFGVGYIDLCRYNKETGDELDIENQYIMSPKDLKTIHFLNKMIDAGVRVFKIEGRARGPEYVKIAVQCYDEALRAICDGTFSVHNAP